MRAIGDSSRPDRPRALLTTALLFLTIFAAVSVVLLLQNADALRRDVVPSGDLAADILLEQKLQRGEGLWVGHYSRLGFNHPGPFFLWVRAASAALLSAAGLSRSRYAAELIGVLLSNAAFLALAAVGLWRYFGRDRGAIAAALLGIAAYWTHVNWWPSPLSDIWVPSQIVAPFFAYLVFVACAARGDVAALFVAAIGGGILIHGHVALPIVAGPLWLLAAAGVLRTGPAGRGIHVLQAAIVLVLVSALPLGIDAARTTPSNAARLLSAAGTLESGSRSADWLGALWQTYSALPRVIWLAAVASVGWLVLTRESLGRVATFVAIGVAATLASAGYARVIPGPSYEYLWYFFAGVPLLIALAAPLELVARIERPALIVVAMGAAGLLVASAPSHGSPYRGSGVAGALAGQIATAAPGPALIGVIWDRHEDWPVATGIVVDRALRGRAVCAVTELWYVFTPEYVCGDVERIYRLRPDGSCISPTARAGRLCLEPLQPLREGHSAVLRAAVPAARGVGWSAPEPWGTWTEGPEASVYVEGAATDLELIVRAHGLIHQRHPRQSVSVSIGDRVLAQWAYTVERPDPPVSIRIPGALLPRGRLVRVLIRTPDAVAPRAIGIGDDSRVLGIGVSELRLQAPAT